jgi:hypothetical protein
MKMIVGLAVIALGVGVYFANGLAAITPYAGNLVKPGIEPDSVAEFCTRAIPQLWESAIESGDDMGGAPEALVFAAFDYVATNYCVCNQEKFGTDKTAREKELFGLFAGLNLKYEFSGNFNKEQRTELEREAQEIAKKHGALIKLQPAWMKSSKDYFRACKNEQQIKGSLLSSVSK